MRLRSNFFGFLLDLEDGVVLAPLAALGILRHGRVIPKTLMSLVNSIFFLDETCLLNSLFREIRIAYRNFRLLYKLAIWDLNILLSGAKNVLLDGPCPVGHVFDFQLCWL
jgi:hypothetical protein